MRGTGLYSMILAPGLSWTRGSKKTSCFLLAGDEGAALGGDTEGTAGGSCTTTFGAS